MPTYEYRCTQCGHRFDIFQRIDDDSLSLCERCGGELRKVFHPAGIVFKGSGFYATDSRSRSKDAKGDGKAAETKKKDSKPADGKPPEKKTSATESS